jgi:hypothetical protein
MNVTASLALWFLRIFSVTMTGTASAGNGCMAGHEPVYGPTGTIESCTPIRGNSGETPSGPVTLTHSWVIVTVHA